MSRLVAWCAVHGTTGVLPSAEPGATNPWAFSYSRVCWLTLWLLWLVAGYCLTRMRTLPRVSRDTAESGAT